MSKAEKPDPAPTKEESALLLWVEEFSPFGVITTDQELRIRTWNSWMEKASGMKASAVRGRKLVELFPNLAEPRFAAPFQRALEGEVSLFSTALHHYLIPLPPANKEAGFEHMQQTARLAPLLLANEILGAIIVIEDVTEREFQTGVVNLQHNRERMLSASLAHLLKVRDVRRSIRELFYTVAENLDFEAYLLYLKEPGDRLKLHATGGIPPEDEAVLVDTLEDATNSWVAMPLSGKPSFVERVPKADAAASVPARLGFRAYILFPLVIGEHAIGVFCLATRSRDTIPRDEEQLLTTISQYLALALQREITDAQLREAQSKLSEHAEALEREVSERTAKLRETISELQTFSYSLAHDLRGPIRSMKGYCEILLDDYAARLPEDAKGLVQRLARSCDRLDNFTRDLLELIRISRQEIVITNVETESALSEVLGLGSPGLLKAVSIQTPLLDVQANQSLLQRCLSNLLENAFKFTALDRSPHINVRTEVVTNGAPPAEAGAREPFNSPVVPEDRRPHPGPAPIPRIRIWVEDNGIGIPAEARASIFGIFERAHGAEKFVGTGIGLAIVARAMQRMGGKCGVESEVGAGSRFWLELPSATS